MIEGEEPIPSALTDAASDPAATGGEDNPYKWAAIACAAHTREDWSEAIRGFRHVVRLRPKCAAAWNALGDAYRREDCPERVDRLEHIRTNLGRAEAAYREVVRLQPDDPDAWKRLGVTLKLREKYAEAVHACHEALRLGGNDSVLWGELAGAYYGLGQHTNAIAAFREALRLEAKHHD
ncbi:MAG: hypothetical protein EHM71_12840, partial [Zetaproteobacteria bacterium]